MYKIVHDNKTMFEALTDASSGDEVVINSPMSEYPNMDLIPSDLSLSLETLCLFQIQ
ncbi:ParA family protein [Clostridioides difficile]